MLFKGEKNLTLSCWNNGKIVCCVQFDENGLLETENPFVIRKMLANGFKEFKPLKPLVAPTNKTPKEAPKKPSGGRKKVKK